MLLWQKAKRWCDEMNPSNRLAMIMVQWIMIICLFAFLGTQAALTTNARHETVEQAQRVTLILAACNSKDKAVFVEGDFYYYCTLGAKYNELDIRNKMYKAVQQLQVVNPGNQVSSLP